MTGGPTAPLHGRCLCGAIQFDIAGPLSPPHACHCSLCRGQSGHFVIATEAEKSDVTFSGEADLAWFQSSDWARRGFCRICGSALFWDDGGNQLSINAGALDPPTGLKLARHIYVDEKPDYYDIDDDLPKFAGHDEPIAPPAGS
ncbi:MAG: GFA family protein [Pseudomonadota bacterium]